MEESLNNGILNEHKTAADQYSPLVLAYIGDAVFEIFVREKIVLSSNRPVNKLHKMSSALVRAQSQARMIHVLKPHLTEKELGIYRRGRNAKSNTSAKNASIKDYRRATGFEALIGYLYLDGQKERMLELMERAVRSEQEYIRKSKHDSERQENNEKDCK